MGMLKRTGVCRVVFPCPGFVVTSQLQGGRSMPTIYTQARRHLRITRNLKLGILHKAFITLAIVAVVLYTMLFTTTPAVHDYFHELRHNLMLIPCH
jgi:ABC-type spermidine/putrescine transport system permease subunit I